MVLGTVFSLAPQDEETLPRSIDGCQTAMGSFYHGMVTKIPNHHVSGGVVLRHVVNTRDVNVATNFVIMSQRERQRFRERKADHVGQVRELWNHQSAQYSIKVASLLVEAFQRWGVDDNVLAALQEEAYKRWGGVLR